MAMACILLRNAALTAVKYNEEISLYLGKSNSSYKVLFMNKLFVNKLRIFETTNQECKNVDYV